MKNIRNITLGWVIFLSGMALGKAQDAAYIENLHFEFSAVNGTTSKPESVLVPIEVTSLKWADGNKAAFRALKNDKSRLVITFSPAPDFTGITRATLTLNDAVGQTIGIIYCTGLSTEGLEGKNEPPLALIAEALGYQVDVGWTSLSNHCLPVALGEEIPSALFRKADPGGAIKMIPAARFSPDYELPFGYYFNSTEMPVKHQVGVLAKAGDFPEHQVLFPALSEGSKTFDPGNQQFGFFVAGPTHTAWSEDAWNMLQFPENAVHATRIYPLRNSMGYPILDAYLVCFEEAQNGDYNDYVFLVTNITPVTNDKFTPLFNGQNLSGWHTFLRGIGSDADPNNNFRVEEEMLHVIGKDLGYAITEKGYKNYHLKVDFKWGEKKWPPRADAKRDAGVCYNIPMHEPDSIWPQSIECQIQEGDVGDFWLLGFSTITVDGTQNVPANHTRMIKKKDAEKPYGEWNTVEIISYNGKCVHIVNGVVVNVGENASVQAGRILLQSEYAEIFYRNIKIREL